MTQIATNPAARFPHNARVIRASRAHSPAATRGTVQALAERWNVVRVIWDDGDVYDHAPERLVLAGKLWSAPVVAEIAHEPQPAEAEPARRMVRCDVTDKEIVTAELAAQGIKVRIRMWPTSMRVCIIGAATAEARETIAATLNMLAFRYAGGSAFTARHFNQPHEVFVAGRVA